MTQQKTKNIEMQAEKFIWMVKQCERIGQIINFKIRREFVTGRTTTVGRASGTGGLKIKKMKV